MSENEIQAAEFQEKQIENGTKWCWSKAWLGFWKLLVDPATIAFVVFTVFVGLILFIPTVAKGMDKYVIIGWIIVTILFIVFASLKKAIGAAIENTKINIEAKASFEKKLTGTLESMASQIIDKVRGGGNE